MKEKAEITREELIALGWMKKPSDKMQEKPKNQLTAVEWLVEQLRMQTSPYTKEQIIEQAKEMEKEQMIEFAKNCLQENDCFFDIEKYYNETFKSE